jgi:hypothetical protein
MPNNVGPFSMMMHPNGMMPFNGMPGMNGHYGAAPGQQNMQPCPGMQHPSQQQQQQQHMMGLPGLPLVSASSGGNGNRMQQQQGLGMNGKPGSVPTSGGMPQMQPSAAMAGMQQQQQRGPQWWPQVGAGAAPGPPPPVQLTQWQQQQPMQLQMQGSMSMPVSSTSSGGAAAPQQMMMQQQQQQYTQQQHVQQVQQQQQPLLQPGAHRTSSGGAPASAAMPGIHRPTPVVGLPYADSNTSNWHQPWQQQQQRVHTVQQVTNTVQPSANTGFTYTGSFCPPQQQQQPQQQYVVQQQQQPSNAGTQQGCSTTSSTHNNSSWMPQLDPAAAAAAAAAAASAATTAQPVASPADAAGAAANGGYMTAGGMQLSSASTATGLQFSNSMRTDSDALAAAGSIPQLPQQQQQQQVSTLAPATACSDPAAAAAAAATDELVVPQLALQQLPNFAVKIVDEFRTELEALRSSMTGSTVDNDRPSEGVGQQQARGNGSSCSNSPSSSSGAAHDNAPGSFMPLHPDQSSTQLAAGLGDAAAAAAAGVAVGAAGSGDLDSSIVRAGSKRSLDDADADLVAADVNGQPLKRRASPLQPDGLTPAAAAAAAEQVKRPGSECIEHQGSHRPASALGGRSWADTPPPAEAQEALLQLAAHVENEVQAAAGQPQGAPKPSAAAAVVGVVGGDAGGGPQGGFQPSDLHTSQVSDLLGAALEAANKCMKDPAPVVQQLLAVLDEHVSLVMAGQHGGRPAAAGGEATATAAVGAADPAAVAAAAGMMAMDVTGQAVSGDASMPAAAAAAASGGGSGREGSVDAAFEAAVAAVQRDCSALHVEVSGHEQQQQQQRMLTPGFEGMPVVPGLTAAVAAAAAAVDSLQDTVMTVAAGLGEDAAVAAVGLECSSLPGAEELQYRLGFEHTAAAGCSPGKIPA